MLILDRMLILGDRVFESTLGEGDRVSLGETNPGGGDRGSLGETNPGGQRQGAPLGPLPPPWNKGNGKAIYLDVQK